MLSCVRRTEQAIPGPRTILDVQVVLVVGIAAAICSRGDCPGPVRKVATDVGVPPLLLPPLPSPLSRPLPTTRHTYAPIHARKSRKCDKEELLSSAAERPRGSAIVTRGVLARSRLVDGPRKWSPPTRVRTGPPRESSAISRDRIARANFRSLQGFMTFRGRKVN